MLNLKEPVKARASDNYLAVIEDADRVVHYWLPDGKYDGYDRPCGKDGKGKKSQRQRWEKTEACPNHAPSK